MPTMVPIPLVTHIHRVLTHMVMELHMVMDTVTVMDMVMDTIMDMVTTTANVVMMKEKMRVPPDPKKEEAKDTKRFVKFTVNGHPSHDVC
jgi:hypothetical protein